MSALPVLERLETDRLVLRRREVAEAAIYRQLWAERDPRVPARRRIDADGRPTVEDIAEQLRAERESSGLVVLAVERKDAGDVIGYCGLFAVDERPDDEPDLAYELLRPAQGSGFTRLRPPRPSSTGRERRATHGCGQTSGTGTRPRVASWRSSASARRDR